jgi:hypothetical protein
MANTDASSHNSVGAVAMAECLFMISTNSSRVDNVGTSLVAALVGFCPVPFADSSAYGEIGTSLLTVEGFQACSPRLDAQPIVYGIAGATLLATYFLTILTFSVTNTHTTSDCLVLASLTAAGFLLCSVPNADATPQGIVGAISVTALIFANSSCIGFVRTTCVIALLRLCSLPLAGSFVCGEVGTSLVVIISAELLRSGTTVFFSYVIGKYMCD